MAFQTLWYQTELPIEMVELIKKTLEEKCNEHLESSKIKGDEYSLLVDKKIRNAKNAWLPSAHWIAGFLMHYVNLANIQNFNYDLITFDNQTLQYTSYEEGEYYSWHTDQSIDTYYMPESNFIHGVDERNLKTKLALNGELVRKLSFSLQLSDPSEYEGGELQILDECNGMYQVPKEQGLLVCFDSRAKHRVRKIKNGCRKSLVGWVVGPRWR